MPDRGFAFPPVDAAAWRKRADASLKGGAFERLISSTFEGLTIEPLYSRAAEGERALRQKPGAWTISQRMDHPDITAADEMALADLENGAGALTLCVAGAEGARGFGLDIANEDDLDAALKGVELDLISLRIDAGARAIEIAPLFDLLAARRRLSGGALDVDFGFDPIGVFARSGAGIEPFAEIGRALGRLRHSLRAGGFTGRLMLADGRPYHEAGGGEAQELAAVLATGLAYLRLLEANGASLEEARDDIAFLLVADADEFLTLAKFRALRRLWAKIEAACGLNAKPARVHAETAFRMMTRRDPWVNICRATVAVFAAGIGGADAITVLPFTLAQGLPDDFARRLARNTQLLLLDEANLAKVADPAAGAGGFEALTDQLCERAWVLFQSFEKSGGMIESLKAGLPQAEIAATALNRREAIARRTLPITGVSTFSDLAEAPVRVLAARPAVALDESAPGVCPGLAAHRDAEPFEALRAASDAAFARVGARPRIFLANLGPTEAFLPRATFATGFFETAGIEVLTNPGFAGALEAGKAFHQSGCKIACICAPAVPCEEPAAAAKALRAAGAAAIYLAARPARTERALRDAGIADFVYSGANALAILENALAAAL